MLTCVECIWVLLMVLLSLPNGCRQRWITMSASGMKPDDTAGWVVYAADEAATKAFTHMKPWLYQQDNTSLNHESCVNIPPDLPGSARICPDLHSHPTLKDARCLPDAAACSKPQDSQL